MSSFLVRMRRRWRVRARQGGGGSVGCSRQLGPAGQVLSEASALVGASLRMVSMWAVAAQLASS